MDVEQEFLRYRDGREPEALGTVFDLVADELFAVALHLARDTADAEDLVQATFLVAIERAVHWDAGRPLRPWLLGILQREAKARRRQRRRAPDPVRLPRPIEPPPVQIALDRETRTVVGRAIATVPEPYREVLELRLVQTLPPLEIAERLRRSPGAVRTQLWRGLEILRQRLPEGLAIGLVPELIPRPAWAAVRRHVVAAAKTTSTTGTAVAGAGALAGAWLMTKAWIAFAAIAMVVVGWLAWPGASTPAPSMQDRQATADVAAADLAVAVEVSGPVGGTEQLAPDREPAAVAGGEPVASTDAVPLPSPVTARLLVVDADGDVVADAEVVLFEPDVVADGKGGWRPARRRCAGPPVWQGHTGVDGRVRVPVQGESFIAARKQGVGATGDLRVHPSMVELRDEWRVVLRPHQHVRGVVLQSDGTPAAGAEVSCHFTSNRYRHLATELPPVTADAEGRFDFEVLPELDYRFHARLDGRLARAYVETRPGTDDYEVALRFPGAYSVRGLLLGADGRPVAGEVRLVSPVGTAWHAAKADADGRFVMLLTEAGSFELVGGVEGQTAAHTPVVLDAARPHAEATLRLTPFLVIAGRAEDERGRPCAGVSAGVSPVRERDAVYRACAELQGIYARGATAEDGSFRFLVPAGCSYQVGYRATPDLFVRGPVVTPPAADIVLVVRESDRRGFTVTCRVFAAATGAAVPAFRVYLVTHEGAGFSDHALGQGSDGAFAAGPLPVDRRYSLRFEAEGLGSLSVGPFDATVREEAVTVRLPQLGSLLCAVLRPDGRPAVGAQIGLDRDGNHPFEPAHQGRTDADGRIELGELSPDDYTVYASAAVPGAGQAMGKVRIMPGQQAAVVLSLQRK
ncbi:MAG: sigma-70 family RNA polymerase sigma factor [Planctomycetes bacterium]|nr:sigma-70 family RNA polymerase sigma factor [Planctomycetota bacterium]